MAIQTNSIPNAIEVMNRWITSVEDVIFSGAYTSSKPPVLNGHQCIPSRMLSLRTSNNSSVGISNGKMTASTVYNNLLSLTKNLTRVGTFSCIEKKNVTRWGTESSKYDVYRETGRTLSGKAVFTTAYVVSMTSPSTSYVATNITISASKILSLISEYLTMWNRANKYHYSDTSLICHDSCHSNCHSNCHSSCHTDCHTDCHDSSDSSDCHSDCKTTSGGSTGGGSTGGGSTGGGSTGGGVGGHSSTTLCRISNQVSNRTC